MFDILELDRLVYKYLDHHTLAQCARVNKRWHKVVMPFLWTSIHCLSLDQQPSFHRIVFDDYVQEHKRNATQELLSQNSDLESTSLTTLAQYGHYVLKVVCPFNLVRCFRFNAPKSSPRQPESGPVPDTSNLTHDVENPVPDENDLLRHFLTRCPRAQFDKISLGSLEFSSGKMLDVIVDLVIPNARSLMVIFRSPTASALQRILLAGANSLETVFLRIDGVVPDDPNDPNSQRFQKELAGSGRIKLLKLRVYKDRTSTLPFWSWLWRFCGKRLEALKLIGIGPRITADLTSHVRDYLPSLEDLAIGDPNYDEDDYEDENWSFGGPQVHGLIWEVHALRSFQINPAASPGRFFEQALLHHSNTIKEIYIESRVDVSDITHVLSRCPNLRIVGSADEFGNIGVKISLENFIDWDPESKMLRPWACESTLTTLQISISLFGGVINENDPGTQVLVRRMFERVARFEKLQILWLGHYQREHKPFVNFGGVRPDWEPAWTLDSGLALLKDLKDMEEVQLKRLDGLIGLEEVQWMRAQWPKLKCVRGLSRNCAELEWLIANGMTY
ncbi:hypothetical protein BGZ93_008554 [Podila epicladia]|nr:hypothetical protein BGZ92_001196 [Podila epicladia]KAG0091975.1 hypothetical protein BGZ93_008554 [Podila epicladia]